MRERLAQQQSGLEVLTEVVGTLDIADATVRTTILASIGEVLGGGQPRTGHCGRSPPRSSASRGGPGGVRRRVRAARPGDHRCAGGRGHPATLRRPARQAAAAAGEPGVAVRRVRRLPGPARRQAHGRLRGVLRRASRRCSTNGRGEPTGWSSRPNASSAAIRRRVGTLASLDEINTYFAADPMVAKLRAVAGDLRELGDVRADELDGRLKDARQEAGRSLRDRADLLRRRRTVRARPASFPGDDRADRPDPGAARRRAVLRGHRHRLPQRGHRPGVRGDHGRSGTSCWSRRRPRSTASEHLAACLLAEKAARTSTDARRGNATTRATSGACTTTTPPGSSMSCNGCTPAPGCCGTRRRSVPPRSCSGRPNLRTSVRAWTRKAESLARARTIFGGYASGLPELSQAVRAGGAGRRVPVRGTGLRTERVRHQQGRPRGDRQVPRGRRPRNSRDRDLTRGVAAGVPRRRELPGAPRGRRGAAVPTCRATTPARR